MDIMKALAEARSTIAGIKKVVAPKEGNNEASETKLVPQKTKSHSPKKRAASPTKKTVKNADVDEFDMFSIDEKIPSAAGLEPSAVTLQLKGMIVAQQANCDDADGYYNTTVGEILNGRYRVLGVVGKGVFSTVLRCQRLGEGGVASPFDTPEVTAVKLIRSNDTMRDASQIEVRILKELAEKDPRDKKHCVRLLDTFEHRNHVALVFEPMQMNLREAMRKFGGKGGISLNAVQIFCKHLLIALNHLESCKVVHAGKYFCIRPTQGIQSRTRNLNV
jgi:serine/threonine-protein kinase PRP4